MAQYIINNQPGAIDFEIGDNLVARTVQNAKNLLLTQMGEVSYDRYCGFDFSLYHLPLDDMRAVLLPELDRLMAYEPDVEVVSARAEQGPEPDSIPLISVTLEVRINE